MSKYPVAAKVIPFEIFSTWVDEALDDMKSMLKNNEAVREFVSGDTQ